MKFEKGNKVICIFNNRANLTVGKEYEVLEEASGDVCVKNDSSETWVYYTSDRFMHKSEFRKFKIDEIVE
jgi:hypothetical protein